MLNKFCFRENIEKNEAKILSKFAKKSSETQGRKIYEKPSPVRTEFQRDRDRIIHSEAFRKLKHKTQVFISPERDFFRTRLTHTITVSQIARTIARALMLNEDLVEASALGHDLGHTPFGHTGEKALNELTDGKFKHYVHSLRVVEFLGKKRQGLNLTFEVKDGIVKHSKGSNDLIKDMGSINPPITLEGVIVRISDSIAYINHDLDDAIVAGIIKPKDIPKAASKILGKRYSERIDSMVEGIVRESFEKGKILIPANVLEGMNILKDFLYGEVYPHNRIKKPAEKAAKMIYRIWEHFQKNKPEFRKFCNNYLDDFSFDQNLIDFIAWLSDDEATRLAMKLK
ncbi:deoxyguanosinetriphosphate triphosphohydrolase [bacterium]|nr:deoxyguanosinetriphosphate triphosphohydrolase [bacterium]